MDTRIHRHALCWTLLTLVLAALLLASCAAEKGDTGATGPAGPVGNVTPLAATVTLSNLRNNGIVETGFVVGTASGTGLIGVLVSLDGGTSWTFASGTSSWTFKLPTGGNTWRDGSLHTIQARTTDGTAFSSPVSISVRKGANKDVNGDGYADVVAGAHTYSSNTGRVYVFHSAGTSAGVTTTAAASAHIIITGEASSQFGQSVALGDVNGDGYADVVAGASGYNPGAAANTGRVYVFHSAGGAGVTATAAASASRIITGETAGNQFGWSVALGDVNGDGYADVVAGAPLHSTSTGRVYVFHSAGGAGVTATAAVSANTVITGETAGNQFGISVALGDVNGDGYADVVAGAWNYSGGTGRVYVFHSAGGAGVTATLAVSASSTITGEAASAFGISVALGDVNGDGYADVVAGAYQYNSFTGRVYVFHSAGNLGVTATAAASANTVITGEAAASSAFGFSLALGDVNGDGYADVVAGAFGYSSGTGRMYVFHSAGAAGVPATAATSASSIVTGEATGESQFGYSVALGDVNGDGYADVVAGAYLYSANTGRAYVFHSAGSGGIAITLAASANTIITGEASSQFGNSVAAATLPGGGAALLLAALRPAVPRLRRRRR